MDVFSVFKTTPYTFLELAQGGVLGNTIISQTVTDGVLKKREGMVAGTDAETRQSDTTLHMRPDEPFLAQLLADAEDKENFLVGHGVRATKHGHRYTYRISAQKEGFNFDTNVLEFYYLTLKAESSGDDDGS